MRRASPASGSGQLISEDGHGRTQRREAPSATHGAKDTDRFDRRLKRTRQASIEGGRMRRPHRARLLPRSSGARCIRSSTWQRADAKGGRTERVWGKKEEDIVEDKPARDERRRRDEGRRDDGGRRIVPPDRTVRARTIDAPPRRRRTSRPRRWLCCVSWLVSRRHGSRLSRRARRLTRRRERVAGCACGSSPPPRYRRGGSSRASVVMMKGQARVATGNAEAGVAVLPKILRGRGGTLGLVLGVLG